MEVFKIVSDSLHQGGNCFEHNNKSIAIFIIQLKNFHAMHVPICAHCITELEQLFTFRWKEINT
jgi:hypothetical protein